MESKKAKNNFFRKNSYYLVLAFVLLAVIAVSVALFVKPKEDLTLNSSNNENQLQNSSTPDLPPNTSSPDLPNDGGNNSEEVPDDKPTATVISFITPVENSSIICDYTATSVVYNQTLNVYTGHLAIDFGADYGEEVRAVYGGTVESVTSSYLTGTTITINHGNNLKTVYNGIEAVEGLAAGTKVAQGYVIGYVSDNNKQEYKDGPHLHFEVWENDQKISPYKYLVVSDK